MNSRDRLIAWQLGKDVGAGDDPEDVASFFEIDMDLFDTYRIELWREYDQGLIDGRRLAAERA